MADIHEFDDIRPFLDEEVPGVTERLLADPEFKAVLAGLYKGVPPEAVAQTLRSCGTKLEFQGKCVYPLIQRTLKGICTGMEADFSAVDALKESGHTYVSNHRDIVLDSALLDCLLFDNGAGTAQIAIGDNLLIRPWIKDLVRLNKSFIVQRALTMRQMLAASAKMSRYMHYAVAEEGDNIWIAQREGRAKDSDDRTQESVLKMMAMGGEGSVVERLKQLNIVPLAISYEYDPCDYLKAREFQQKRDTEGFKKSKQDDLDNMKTGIFGYKGHIHYHAAPCINDWLDTIDPSTPKTELFGLIAAHIDREIHSNYRLYPCNYAAADLLDTLQGKSGDRRTGKYTAEEKAKFEAYIAQRTAMVELPAKDEAFIRERLLTMYANPVYNNEKALAAR